MAYLACTDPPGALNGAPSFATVNKRSTDAATCIEYRPQSRDNPTVSPWCRQLHSWAAVATPTDHTGGVSYRRAAGVILSSSLARLRYQVWLLPRPPGLLYGT